MANTLGVPRDTIYADNASLTTALFQSAVVDQEFADGVEIQAEEVKTIYKSNQALRIGICTAAGVPNASQVCF